MSAPQIEQVRRFNRLVTQRTGALDDHFLGRDRPLGESRLLYEIGATGSDIRDLRRRLGLDAAMWEVAIGYYGRGDVARVVTALVAWRAMPEDLVAWEEYRRVVLAERNQTWVAPLERIFGRDGTHFVAFGCGHLPGTDGVVALLRDRGWDVRPCLGDACG